MAWMNALVGRIFWDFLREKYWADQVSNKIQKKLSKIKVRGFCSELSLGGLLCLDGHVYKCPEGKPGPSAAIMRDASIPRL